MSANLKRVSPRWPMLCAVVMIALGCVSPASVKDITDATDAKGVTRTTATTAPVETAASPPAKPESDSQSWRLDAGPLHLNIFISKTAHLFHVVDQLSLWGEFCHAQYRAHFDKLDGGLAKDDLDLLARHVAVRKAQGWGRGLEQTFYTPLDLEPALDAGVAHGHLSREDAETERRILSHFAPRVERLMAEERPTLDRFAQTLLQQREDLAAFAKQIGGFAGVTSLAIPVYLIANPDARNCGGGYNGGRLTLEIPKDFDVYPMFLHENFHAFVHVKETVVENAAHSAPGLDFETLNEALAYAYSPGLRHSGDSDPLLGEVASYLRKGESLDSAFPRFNAYGLALRPLLKEALATSASLEAFLPRATDAWKVLRELDMARAKSREERQGTGPGCFLFGHCEKDAWNALYRSLGMDLWGRAHDPGEYRKMLATLARKGDMVILLLSLDDSGRVPDEYADLLPTPWSEIEGRLKKGDVIFQQGAARGWTVYLLAAPTKEALNGEFRRLIAEKTFVCVSRDGSKGGD